MKTANTAPVDQELSQSAIQCYLSAILCAADCIAAICPMVGVPYQQRWRRLPQRLGFDLSPASLKSSELLFASEMQKFTQLAGPYFNQGLPLMQGIAAGGDVADAVLEETASAAILLNTLAESTETAADLEAPPEMREMLESHAEALRRCARQLQGRLLDPLQRLSGLIRDCGKLAAETQDKVVLDTETSLTNVRGFRYELDSRFQQKGQFCVGLFECAADAGPSTVPSAADLGKIAAQIAAQLLNQFRPADCLARLGTLCFGVIFDTEKARMDARCQQIARTVSGVYKFASGSISLSSHVRIIEIVDADSFAAMLEQVEQASACEFTPQSAK